MYISLLSTMLASCSTQTGDSAQIAVVNTDSWARQELERMEKQVNQSSALRTLNDVENMVADLESGLFYSWTQTWKNKNAKDYQKLLIQSGLDWHQASSLASQRDGIEEHEWSPKAGRDTAQAYLDGFSKIDDVQIDILNAQANGAGMLIEVRFQLRGQIKQQRQHDRGTLKLQVSLHNDAWHIQEFLSVELERLRSVRAPIFSDATKEWGLDSLPISDRKEAIRRGGYALAAVDYNDDKLPDVLVGHYGSMQLLKNTGNGFVDVTRAEGLTPENVVKSAAIVDIDGDGDQDILALRFVETSDQQVRDFVAYENMGEGASPRFKVRHDLLPRSRSYDRAMPLTLADFNNDGTLDIYIGFPGIRDFTSGIANRERPQEQASQGLWFNKGNWVFEESEGTLIEDNSVYAHAALASDLDGDGTVELLVVDDSGRINPLYKRDQTGDYKNVATQSGLASSGMSMGITTGDFNGDGLLDIMSTNVTLLAGSRLLHMAENAPFANNRFKGNFKTIADGYSGLMLYQNKGDGTFELVEDEQLSNWHGEAAASGEWIDYNHDGLLDYYLPNGLWSSGEEKLDSLFFRYDITSFPDPLYTGIETPDNFGDDIQTNDVHGGSNFGVIDGTVSNQEKANPILRLLRTHHDENGVPTLSLGGYQHNALFRNNGDGTFTEVGYLENADRIEDGYIVAPVDVDLDGRQDLVLRNTDPALGHSYAPVVLLKNNHVGAKTACVRIPSDRSPFGVRITAEINGKTHLREVRSVNGAVQADPVVIFGLGTANTAENVTLHWPNGEKESLGSISSCQ